MSPWLVASINEERRILRATALGRIRIDAARRGWTLHAAASANRRREYTLGAEA